MNAPSTLLWFISIFPTLVPTRMSLAAAGYLSEKSYLPHEWKIVTEKLRPVADDWVESSMYSLSREYNEFYRFWNKVILALSTFHQNHFYAVESDVRCFRETSRSELFTDRANQLREIVKPWYSKHSQCIAKVLEKSDAAVQSLAFFALRNYLQITKTFFDGGDISAIWRAADCMHEYRDEVEDFAHTGETIRLRADAPASVPRKRRVIRYLPLRVSDRIAKRVTSKRAAKILANKRIRETRNK